MRAISEATGQKRQPTSSLAVGSYEDNSLTTPSVSHLRSRIDYLRRELHRCAVNIGGALVSEGEPVGIASLERSVLNHLKAARSLFAASPDLARDLLGSFQCGLDQGVRSRFETELESIARAQGEILANHRLDGEWTTTEAHLDALQTRADRLLAQHASLVELLKHSSLPLGAVEFEHLMRREREVAIRHHISLEELAFDLRRLSAAAMPFAGIARLLASPRELESRLFALTHEELTKVAKRYEARYGSDLSCDLQRISPPTARAAWASLFAGRQLEAKAALIAHVSEKRFGVWGPGPKEAAVIRCLMATRSPAEHDQLLDKLRSRLKQQSVEGAIASIASRFGGARSEYVSAVLGASWRIADAVAMHLHISKREATEALLLLSSRSSIERAQIQDAYSTRYNKELVEDARLNLPTRFHAAFDGLLGDVALYGDVQTLAQGLQHGSPWPGSVFLHKDTFERDQIMNAYDRQFGRNAFFRDLHKRWHGPHAEIIEEIARTGKVSLAALLYFCVDGPGADEESIRNLLKRTNPEDLAHARREFREMTHRHSSRVWRFITRERHRDLDLRLRSEVHGDLGFDIRESLVGAPKTSREAMEQVRRYVRHERSGPLSWVLTVISKEFELFLDDTIRADRFDAECSRLSSSDSTSDYHSEWRAERCRALAEVAKLDCEALRRAKHLVGNQLGGLATGIGAIGGGAVGSLAGPGGILLGTICGAAISRIGAKILVKGGGYHPQELFTDVVLGVTNYPWIAGLPLDYLLLKGTDFALKWGAGSGMVRFGSHLYGRREEGLGMSAAELQMTSKMNSLECDMAFNSESFAGTSPLLAWYISETASPPLARALEHVRRCGHINE